MDERPAPSVDTFDMFVAQHYARLVRAAALLLGRDARADAEDVVQDVLIDLYRRWPAINIAEARYSYAYRCLIRRVSRRRLRVSRISLPAAEPPEWLHTDSGDTNEELVEALKSLPRRQRQVLILRFIEDFSVARTAEIMASSESTVKSQTAKALDKLRRMLETSNDEHRNRRPK